VQACSGDPQVAFHAVRNLARIGRGAVVMRWSQLGFGRTATTSRSQDTPRNLMGFKDGTANIRAEDSEAMDRFVWLGRGDGPTWMRGGSYMVTRRIRMLLEVWDRSALEDQEQTIGRAKYSGAPLGGNEESDPLDLEAKSGGKPVIPADAHVRLASDRSTTGSASCAAATPSPTASMRASASSKQASSSSARPRAPVRRDPAPPRLPRRTQRVHQAHRQAVFAARPGGYIGETMLD
jgi:deferrochelatase/peroxidase EfeB